jgi:hypothetical protein
MPEKLPDDVITNPRARSSNGKLMNSRKWNTEDAYRKTLGELVEEYEIQPILDGVIKLRINQEFDKLSDDQLITAILLVLGFNTFEIGKVIGIRNSVFIMNRWHANPVFIKAHALAKEVMLTGVQPQVEDYSNLTKERAKELLGGLISNHMHVIQARSMHHSDDPIKASGLVVTTLKNIGGQAVEVDEYDKSVVDGLTKCIEVMGKVDGLFDGDKNGGDIGEVMSILFPTGIGGITER